MSKFSHFALKKLYFKRYFNNIVGNRGPLFSQINSDKTYFFLGGGGFVQGVARRGYVLKRNLPRSQSKSFL